MALAFVLGLFLGTGVGCLIVSLCVAAARSPQAEPPRRSGP